MAGRIKSKKYPPHLNEANKLDNDYGQPWGLSSDSAAWAGRGLAFTACGTWMRCDRTGERADVGLLSLPTCSSSDNRGATTRNASTSISSLDSSNSFCLRTS